MNIALAGNPNCGKTTLFNALTGAKQKVGNFSGVTVEKKEGRYKKAKDITIIDLPGVYSLNAASADEKVVTDYLKNSPPDVIINVVDGNNLLRNLFLTTLLVQKGIPVVIALNYADELEKKGIKVDCDKLGSFLNCPVIAVSARKKKNLDKLIAAAISVRNKGESGRYIIKSFAGDKDRYDYIDKGLKEVIKKDQVKDKKRDLTDKADAFFMRPLTGLPLFFIIIAAVYFLTDKTGGTLCNLTDNLFISAADSVKNFLTVNNLPEWFISLISSALIKGVGTVASFLPQILVLFFFMSILEESGYMSRVAFVFDGIFRRFGMSGKSVVPLVLSCGCSVTGIMSARTIEDEHERITTVILAPFMPCGAKTVVIGWLTKTLFNGSPLIFASLFCVSLFSVGFFGAIFKRTGIIKSDGAFLLEIPPFRFPSFKNVFYSVYNKTKEFAVKAGTVIFAISVVLWALLSFGARGYVGSDVSKSLLYTLGSGIKYLFYPLGFSGWQPAVAIISGLFAREGAAQTLSFTADLTKVFSSGYSAYAFLVFELLSPPCIAATACAKKELGDSKKFFLMLAVETAAAYIAALIINCVGIVAGYNKNLIFIAVSVIILSIGVYKSIKAVLYKGCGGCHACNGSREKCNRKHNSTI